MNKLYVLSVIVFTVFCTSCNFTEEIYFEEDGSGKISINFDGSGLMDMLGDEMEKSSEEAVDSIMSFKTFIEEHKDSIAGLSVEEQTRLKRLEPFSVHVVMDPETKVMNFEMFSDFENINEVEDMFNTFQSASAINPLGGGPTEQNPFGGEKETTEVHYSFKGKLFSRKAKIIDTVLHKQSLDSLQGMEMFLSGSSYTLKYHFPKRVKSASLEDATYSADGKTLIYEVGFMEYMKNPETLNLEVELED